MEYWPGSTVESVSPRTHVRLLDRENPRIDLPMVSCDHPVTTVEICVADHDVYARRGAVNPTCGDTR